MLPYERPEKVAANKLITAGLGLTTGENLFLGPPKPSIKGGPIPRSAVFLYEMHSFEPRPYIGNGQDFRVFRMTAYVRHVQDKFEEGQNLAREIWQALQRMDVSAYPGYVGCLMAEANPMYIGQDDIDCHRWTMVARYLYKG